MLQNIFKGVTYSLHLDFLLQMFAYERWLVSIQTNPFGIQAVDSNCFCFPELDIDSVKIKAHINTSILLKR